LSLIIIYESVLNVKKACTRFRALTHSDCMTLYFVQAAQQFSNLPTFFTFLFQQLWWVVSNRKRERYQQ